MKPGIYLNMPEDTYHAIDALGSTSIKALFDDATEYKWDRDHPDDDRSSAAMTLGSAIHKRILEGREAFEAAYYVKLDPAPWIEKGALNTVDDFKAWLRERGLGVTGVKDKLKERVREEDAKQLILDEVVADHAAENEGKELLTEIQWVRVCEAAEWCQQDAMLSKFMEDGTFVLGLTEVSVIAEIDGVPVKARFDMLGNHMILDLKSFAPFMNKDPVMAIPYHIRKMGYLLQAGHYLNLWQEAKKLYAAGQVFGSHPEGFFDKVFERELPTWVWLFVKTVGAPQPYVRELHRESTARVYAQRDALEAILFYRQKVEKYGLDKPWPPHNRPVSLGDEELL